MDWVSPQARTGSFLQEEHNFYIDPARCIGCNACVQACSECDTHKGQSMIQLDFIDRSRSTQTVPVICMHCDQPTCAEVCPADAIKRTEDGVVHTPAYLPTMSGDPIAVGRLADGQERYAVRFEWVEGHEPDESRLVSDFGELGAITARLHGHARTGTEQQ